MKIVYYEEDDILFLELAKGEIVRDESASWNVNIGYTADGIGEITILDAQRAESTRSRSSEWPRTPLDTWPVRVPRCRKLVISTPTLFLWRTETVAIFPAGAGGWSCPRWRAIIRACGTRTSV